MLVEARLAHRGEQYLALLHGPGTEPSDPSEAVIISFYAMQLLALAGGALLALGLIALYARLHGVLWHAKST
jgi:hypothetical protein